jgi:hypothetical protein
MQLTEPWFRTERSNLLYGYAITNNITQIEGLSSYGRYKPRCSDSGHDLRNASKWMDHISAIIK